MVRIAPPGESYDNIDSFGRLTLALNAQSPLELLILTGYYLRGRAVQVGVA